MLFGIAGIGYAGLWMRRLLLGRTTGFSVDRRLLGRTTGFREVLLRRERPTARPMERPIERLQPVTLIKSPPNTTAKKTSSIVPKTLPRSG